MPTDLLFIRHGEARYGSNDGLTSLGARQASALGRRLDEQGIDHLYSSPLPRARDTAVAVAQATGREPHFDARLREIDVGEFSRLPDREIKRRSEDYFRPDVLPVLDFSDRNGEGPTELHVRAAGVLCDLFLGGAPDLGRVAVVSHGGFINAALCILLGMEFSGPLRFRLANTSITTARIVSGGAVLLAVNDTTHLHSLTD